MGDPSRVDTRAYADTHTHTKNRPEYYNSSSHELLNTKGSGVSDSIPAHDINIPIDPVVSGVTRIRSFYPRPASTSA